MKFVDDQTFQFWDFPCLIGPDKVCKKAWSDKSRKLTGIGCLSEWISKPERDQFSVASYRLPKLITIQIASFFSESGPRLELNEDNLLPEIVR